MNSKDGEKPRRKSRKSRREIMHGAKELLEEKGIDGVTFNDIAKRAGVCRTTVFNHFANTEQLLLEIYRQEISDLEEHYAKKKEEGEDGIKALFEKLIEDTCYYPLLSYRLMCNAVVAGKEGDSITRIEEIIRLELSENENREDLIILIMGAYYGLVNHYHAASLDFQPDKLKEEFGHFYKMLKTL